jgi:hypothetical protein
VTIGAAIFIAALGAILRYAVSDNIEGIDLQTVGTILIIAGVVGLIVGLALLMGRRDDRYRDDRYRERDEWMRPSGGHRRKRKSFLSEMFEFGGDD